MKTIKVSEATGAALDWLVAKALGLTEESVKFPSGSTADRIVIGEFGRAFDMLTGKDCAYSTDWSQGGPIIEREQIAVVPMAEGWEAQYEPGPANSELFLCYGPTFLIAAMRCYVTSKLGETAEVPEELT